MSLWDALRMNMMISYQELVRTFPKKVFIYAMGGIILPFLASCGDDKNETKYEGVNKIYLSAQDPVIEEMEDTPLTVSVDLTSACEQDMSFNFKILNDEDGIL